MKKSLLLSLSMLLLVTGCGKSNMDTKVDGDKKVEEATKTNEVVLFRCGNGNVKNNVIYKEYKVKGTEILEFNSYEISIFKSKEEMENKYEFYKKLDIYDIEKINDTTLKLIDRDPINVYELADAKETYEEMIKDYEEDGDFCQISKDGKTFETLESNLSAEDDERNGWDNSIYNLDEYDSEIFYTNDSTISYEMIDGFKTDEKSLSKKKTSEYYKNSNGNIYGIWVRVMDTDYNCYEKDGHARGADSESYTTRKFDLDYDERHSASEIKTIKVGNYNVYYYHLNSYLMGEYGASTHMFFEINDAYVIEIDASYKSNIKFDDIKDNDIKEFEDLIKSFKIEKK